MPKKTKNNNDKSDVKDIDRLAVVQSTAQQPVLDESTPDILSGGKMMVAMCWALECGPTGWVFDRKTSEG